MERRKREGSYTPQKTNSMEDLVVNKEMDTQFLTLTKQ
jgi:hypothetical protein